jgi:hypothetical protein
MDSLVSHDLSEIRIGGPNTVFWSQNHFRNNFNDALSQLKGTYPYAFYCQICIVTDSLSRQV